MKGTKIPVNPVILKWARETAGYSLEILEKQFPNLSKWEIGEDAPTYCQLKQLSIKYKRAIAVFFFPIPPEEPLVEKSLRALSIQDLENLNPKVRFLFRKANLFQTYLKEIFFDKIEDCRNKIKWLNQNTNKPINEIAKNARDYLNVPIKKQKAWSNNEQALKYWRNQLAEKGIYVFKEAFDNDKISGFCIYNKIFPIIFLNNSLSKTRQIFTLFHELAHLIFNQSFLDVFDKDFWKLKSNDTSNIEIKCNIFAAHFLVPDDSFLSELNNENAIVDEVKRLAKYYKVSREVVLRKMLDKKIITANDFDEKITEIISTYRNKKGGKGGNYVNTKSAYLGDYYLSTVLKKYYNNEISEKQAAEYLDINLKTFPQLESIYFKKEMVDVRF